MRRPPMLTRWRRVGLLQGFWVSSKGTTPNSRRPPSCLRTCAKKGCADSSYTYGKEWTGTLYNVHGRYEALNPRFVHWTLKHRRWTPLEKSYNPIGSLQDIDRNSGKQRRASPIHIVFGLRFKIHSQRAVLCEKLTVERYVVHGPSSPSKDAVASVVHHLLQELKSIVQRPRFTVSICVFLQRAKQLNRQPRLPLQSQSHEHFFRGDLSAETKSILTIPT